MLETILPFALTSLIIELTPGPNMGYLAVLSIDRGRRAGLAAVAGVAVGLLLLGLGAGFGLGSIISETRWLYETLRWGGVAYLVWLAWDSYREAQQPLEQDGGDKNLLGTSAAVSSPTCSTRRPRCSTLRCCPTSSPRAPRPARSRWCSRWSTSRWRRWCT